LVLVLSSELTPYKQQFLLELWVLPMSLRIFLVVRTVAPLIYTYIVDRSDEFFSGGSDSNAYIELGQRVATQFELQGYSQVHRAVPGTGAIDLTMGHIFRIAGVDRLAANYLMTGMSSIGIILFWVSTRNLMTNERIRNIYAYLLLLAPTTAFWSASVSKEAPILLGVACVSAAFFELFDRHRRLTPRIGILFGVGSLCLGYVRPHVALLLILAIVGATFLSSGRMSMATTGQRRLLVGVFALGGLLVAIPLSEELLGVNEGGSLVENARDASEQNAEGQGRSAYQAEPVRGIADVPRALVSVLLRPYPWEIETPFQALAAGETFLYMGLLLYAIMSVGTTQARLLRHPAMIFGSLYIALMSSALVTYGNIGLLVRQRMQIWPHLILLSCLLLSSKRRPASQLPVIRTTRSKVT
jgi:hypothetical protein